MSLNANHFIRSRKNVVKITYDRINNIMWYIVECYNKLLLDNPAYSKSWVSNNTNYHFEDYLKMKFVEDYLKTNKKFLIEKTSALVEITFHYETVKGFTDVNDSIEKSDKIDVYVNKLGLKNEWAVEDEDLYLAIECKRIKKLSDCKEYVDDIQDFCDRQYQNLRIPFEGQIGFIEDFRLNHPSISAEVNKRLKKTTTINTTQFLQIISLNSSFAGSYASAHKKNYSKGELFSIFHLLLDYSNIVVN